MNIPQADIVIIGGGVIGCAIAWQLANAGYKNVLVVEKGEIGGVTTSQAAGLIGQVRDSVGYTQLTMRSIHAFQMLAADGFDPGWHPVGSLRIALSHERDAEFHHLLTTARKSGLNTHKLTPAQLAEQYPALRLDEVISALHCPDDGYVEPLKLTRAYAAAAEKHGVHFLTGVTVYDVLIKNERVIGLETDGGTIPCATVINAAGFFAARIAQKVQVRMPAIPIRHELIVLGDVFPTDETLPVVRFPDLSAYVRQSGHDLMIGCFEQNPLSFDPRSLYDPAHEPAILSNLPEFERLTEKLQTWLPMIAGKPLKRLQKGLPTCTPDGEFLLGFLRDIEGFIMASGCNVHGISGSAGIAEIVTEAVRGRIHPLAENMDVQPIRYMMRRWSWEEVTDAAAATYANYYAIRGKTHR